MTRLIAASLSLSVALAGSAEAACRNEASGETTYVVCDFDPWKDDIRLFLNDESGAPFGDFGPLVAALDANGETLLFAMNAGMYHKDRSPVGLYIENAEEK